VNRFSYTKYFFILTVLVTGFLYALPNIFPTQPAIQIAYTDSGKSADQALKNKIDEIILNNSIAVDEVFLRDNKLVLKFTELDEQLKAKTIIQKSLLDKVIIALNLEPSTPDWLKNIGGKPLKLGLDLSGGVHFLLEVDIDTAIKTRLDPLLDSFRKTFQDEGINIIKSSVDGMQLSFTFKDDTSYQKGLQNIQADSILPNGTQYIIYEKPSSNTINFEYSDIAKKRSQRLRSWPEFNYLKK
jgi:preprotein translocase subunit SecD